MQGRKLDRDLLHARLWRDAIEHRQHLTEIYQGGLATELGVTQATLSLAMKDLVQEGRIKKIRARPNNVGVYLVREPPGP